MDVPQTSLETIQRLLANQRTFFRSGNTLSLAFRKTMLKQFASALTNWETRLYDALWTDLNKSREEAFLTEISIVKQEIRMHLSQLDRWAKPNHRPTPLKLFPSRSYLIKEPLGTALIVSPWNYPVQLLLNPLVGAISSGCTAILKPSPYVPHVSKVLEEMVSETFDESYVAVVQGNRETNKLLFNQRWDLIFFTGSPALAREVMAAAAQHLTPVVLELGGKSPCVLDRTANVALAARRIAWGKSLNSGQTCIAPDYLLLHKDVKEAFVEAFNQQVKQLHGADPRQSPHYVRMVNDKAFQRVAGYLTGATLLSGGRMDATERYIEPTLVEATDWSSPMMTEEIFGPVFPVVTIDDKKASFKDQVIDFIVSREKPLALYYFGREKDGWEIVKRTSSGGACINDVIMHIANEHLPFGGVGNSGMGRYHGKESFLAFNHQRSILVSGTWADPPFRYMPYKLFRWIKHIL